MSGRTRRTVMAGFVVLVLLWPMIHLAIVSQARIDPWEFFGWAMYSQPAQRVRVRVAVEREGETRPLRAMGEMRRRVRDFARARTALGTFASPEKLVAKIFASDETIDAVVLALRDVRLDLESAYIVAEDERLRFGRTAADR